MSYNFGVAFVFASPAKQEQRDPLPVSSRDGIGVPVSPFCVCVGNCAVRHLGFARQLASWLCQLSWFPSADGRPHSDVSWLEVFWGFIYDAACLPPFRAGSSWVSVDDDVSFGFVLPTVKVLFRTWRCCLDCLVRGGLIVPWVALPSTQSAVELGARFVCFGISGLLALPLEARVDLSFQFARSRS